MKSLCIDPNKFSPSSKLSYQEPPCLPLPLPLPMPMLLSYSSPTP
ncbi:hypothetical protein Golax_002355, partial [Gossypium laxum]|nr:hypothetical protein [Gossypium laxum]